MDIIYFNDSIINYQNSWWTSRDSSGCKFRSNTKPIWGCCLFLHVPTLFTRLSRTLCPVPSQKSFSALITPINNKNHVTKMLMGDFFVVLLFYLLLSITAAFCFDVTVIQDIYTLNFLLDCKGTISNPIWQSKV